MKNWVKRMLRTFVQAAVGYISVNLCLIDFSSSKEIVRTAVIGLIVSAVAAGLSAIMNYKEV